MPRGWSDLFSQHNRPLLEREVLPAFLPRQRWFAAKGQRLRAAQIRAYCEIEAPSPEPGETGSGSFLLQLVEPQVSGAERRLYLLPLAAEWSPAGSEQRQALAAATVAQ